MSAEIEKYNEANTGLDPITEKLSVIEKILGFIYDSMKVIDEDNKRIIEKQKDQDERLSKCESEQKRQKKESGVLKKAILLMCVMFIIGTLMLLFYSKMSALL